ncbi:hypothetical protein BDQ12DRAFT_689691 [Crucibulum laeve]|uniref:RING-type domain-containing protein n=1 Tax=Crucibulum laeve TaxID=68775 RepID=A0A5C3M0G2_9AGAR|nr:hypothetical protein BDQ12DRAFT_689691 [Crucibulum laeve]
MAKLLVFETVTDGGFGKMLKLEEGALLELGRWEHVLGRKASERASGSTSPLPPAIPEEASPSASADGGLASQAGRNQHQHNRRRFTHFHFRKRSQNRSVSGPALTVVDAEPQQQQQQDKKDAAKDEAEEGVRVTIRLAALDEQGSELASPNEQVTYLHVVRYGPRPEGGAEDEEDTRPWVVKVVKREATIGPHTFHLHEIYGLTSSTTNNYAPTSALPAVTNSHTYPPDPNALDTQEAAVAPGDEDDPQSECLLCLSAAREVVLLPCRHLVACKDCALNMVEFGAGGNITQAPEPSTGSGAGDAEGGEGGEVGAAVAAGGPAVPAPTITTTTNPRRKRKAKGWFCPVCRQPYTSLLRITTTPPPPASHKQEGGSGPEDGDPSSSTAGTGNATTETGGGILGGMLRPGFLRGLSSFRTGTQPPPAPPAIDVESQAGLGGRGS